MECSSCSWYIFETHTQRLAEQAIRLHCIIYAQDSPPPQNPRNSSNTPTHPLSSPTQEMMTTAFELYRMRGKYCDAVRVALRMDDSDLLAQLLAECEDKGMTQQMRYVCTSYGMHNNRSGRLEERG